MPEWVFRVQSLCSKITGNQYGCSWFSTLKLKHEISRFQPDLVNLHCINANMVNVIEIIEYLKSHHIPTVITFHAEFLYTGGCAHAQNCSKWKTGCENCPQKFKPLFKLFAHTDYENRYWSGLKSAYSDFDNLKLTCVSPWVKSRVEQSPFFAKQNICVTPNGVDTSIFKPTDSEFLRKRYNITPEAKVYLHITPNFKDPLKGGKYVIELAEKLLSTDPEARMIIVGLEHESSKLPPNIITVGRTTDTKELAAFYSMADATILTSSRETFSMVTAESLCCGTPVVGFKAGGPESICTEGHASFVEYGDMNTYIEALKTTKKAEQINRSYSPIFSINNMIKKYAETYNSLI